MCSVWVHGPGACVSFAVAKFLVLATEELDCSRRSLHVSRPSSTHVLLRPAWVRPTNKEQLHSGPSNVRFASDAGCARTTSRTSSRGRRTRTAASVPRGNRPTRFLGVRIAQPSCPRRASRKARDLFRAGNRNCAWAYRQASRCDRVDFNGIRVGDACCQSCKAAGVNDLLSQDLEFVLG